MLTIAPGVLRFGVEGLRVLGLGLEVWGFGAEYWGVGTQMDPQNRKMGTCRPQPL